MTYEGWSNYETWAVVMWINNDECSYNYWLAEAAKAEVDISDLADRLRVEFGYAMPELCGVWGDLMESAFGEVNWDEIAGSMVDGGSAIREQVYAEQWRKTFPALEKVRKKSVEELVEGFYLRREER